MVAAENLEDCLNTGNPRSHTTGTVVGYGVALQASCLEGFDSLGLHHNDAGVAQR